MKLTHSWLERRVNVMQVEKHLKQILMSQRGWSVRQPRREKVVLMLTGGLDSSLLADMCITELDCEVFPLYIRRGAQAQLYEENAAQRVVEHLQEKHGNVMHDLYTLDVEIPPSKVKAKLDAAYVQELGHPVRNSVAELYAVQYAVSLTHTGSTVHTVILGAINEDVRPDSGHLSLLAATITTCISTNDWGWQIMSPFLTEGLLPGAGKINKEVALQWGVEHNFPVSLTRSCTSRTQHSCGKCKACVRRKALFLKKGLRS